MRLLPLSLLATLAVVATFLVFGWLGVGIGMALLSLAIMWTLLAPAVWHALPPLDYPGHIEPCGCIVAAGVGGRAGGTTPCLLHESAGDGS